MGKRIIYEDRAFEDDGSGVFYLLPEYAKTEIAELGKWRTQDIELQYGHDHRRERIELAHYNEIDITVGGFGYSVTFDPPTITRDYTLDSPGEAYNPLPDVFKEV